MSRWTLTPRRKARIRREALSLGQAGLGALLIGGIVWAGTQPQVTDWVDGLSFVREESEGVTPGSTTVALEQATLICPGPELIGLEGAREVPLATSATVISPPLDVLGDIPKPAGESALELLAPTAAEVEPVSAEDPATGVTGPLSQATAYLAVGYGSVAPGMVATQEVRAQPADSDAPEPDPAAEGDAAPDVEEVAGLASVPCQAPRSSSWVLGGGGAPGRAERLIISNPGSNPVTVGITAFGAEGTRAPAGGQGLVIPAQGRVVLLVDGLVEGEATPAFRIDAEGGDVVAVMVETAIEGTQPMGIDVVAATAEPSEEQVIPGVFVPEAGAGTLTLRVVNPGETEVIGTVTALTATGELPLPNAVLRAPAGSVVDVTLEGLPAGPTSLAVAADAPIVAAARTQLTGASYDAGWAVSQMPATGVTGAALPAREGITRSAVIAARGAGATVRVTELVDGRANTSDVLVPTDATVVFPLTGSGVWLETVNGTGEVYAAVLSTNSDDTAAISSMPVIRPEVSARRSEVIPLG